MRPGGEIGRAIIAAAHEFKAIGQGATLAELAGRACISQQAARNHVPKLKSRGHLQIVGERRVDYRNRPVAEYAPTDPADLDSGPGWVDLGQCLAEWVR
ncbi:MAG: hypothetical protein KA777_01345 [Rhodoferax sp.]|nr:hypothetical protein [Rhodoferax sp.]